MRKTFGLYSGHCYEQEVKTHVGDAKLAALKISAYRKHKVYVIEQTYAPDGTLRITAPVMAGTWSGKCGSTYWIDDPEFTFFLEQNLGGDGALARTSQVWHRRAVRGHLREKEKPLGGFRVVCQQPHAEEHECSVETVAGLITWDWKANVLFTIQAAWEVEGVW